MRKLRLESDGERGVTFREQTLERTLLREPLPSYARTCIRNRVAASITHIHIHPLAHSPVSHGDRRHGRGTARN